MFGRLDGQFIISKDSMDELLDSANGNIQYIQDQLGVEGWEGQNLVRIDISNVFDYSPRIPDSSLSGANEKFMPGGETQGGFKELVIDPVEKSRVKITEIKMRLYN